MLKKRGKVWWYKFSFGGRLFQESAKTRSKSIAAAAERQRRRELEEGYNGLRRRAQPRLFRVASDEWLSLKRPSLAPRSYRIELTNLKHLLPHFGDLLITDIGADDIARYQQSRRTGGASAKTVNLEVGTLRAILRRNRLWANIQPDVRMLPTRDDAGKAITPEEERRLLDACASSRSRVLHPIVMLALNTGMRYGEIVALRWGQIDLAKQTVAVGASKTEAGTGRVIPLNDRANAVLRFWVSRFPDRHPGHFVFPSERYGGGGNGLEPHTYASNPDKPIKRVKEAWESAKSRAGVACRFHDLRHTCCTRMLEGAISLPIVSSILGWSAATAVRMARRYGHIGTPAQRAAVSLLNGPEDYFANGGAPLSSGTSALGTNRAS